MARPLKVVDTNLLIELAKIHCTMEEMATICKVSVDTLERRFAETIKDARQHGKSSLRRKMFEMALSGDRVMLIWLSKQHLDMTEKQEQKHEISDKQIAVQNEKNEAIKQEILTILRSKEKSQGDK